MSAIENTIPSTPRIASLGNAHILPRLILVGLTMGFITWTGYWVRQAVPMVQANTRIGSGTWGSVLEGHEIFEFVFFASHYLVRWAPGAVLFVGALIVLRGRSRRIGTSVPAA